jgi:TLC domain
MYRVYNARIYDKLKLKSMETAENLYAMIPTTGTGELSFFTPIMIGSEKVPSFWQFIKLSKLMVFHHMFIGTYGLVVISSWRGGLGDCVFSFMFLMEMSTPFVSFRAILSILNLKRSKLYVINGLGMIFSFLIFRILMLPTLLYYYSTVVKLSFVQAIMILPLGCKLSIVALFLPQFYWFNLMVKAAMRVRE